MLTTNRLVLRRPTLTDAPQVQFLRSDKRVNAYVKRPLAKTQEEAKVFIEKVLQGAENEEMLYWAIALKDTPTMMGSICLWHFSSNRKTAEVGYDLHLDFWNKGYMSEALGGVIHFGFNELNLTSIKAYTHCQNEASTNLLNKHGFKLTGEFEEGNPDNVVYGLIANCI